LAEAIFDVENEEDVFNVLHHVIWQQKGLCVSNTSPLF
jgi:hypothetical protein